MSSIAMSEARPGNHQPVLLELVYLFLALALMVVVSGQLARTAVVDVLTLAVASISAVLLLFFRFNTAWLVLCAAGLSVLLQIAGVPRM